MAPDRLPYLPRALRNAALTAMALTLLSCGGNDGRDRQPANQTAGIAAPSAGTPAALQQPLQRRAFFGDLHVHTAWSLDSYINLAPAGPREAFRFALGETVTLSGGRKLQLSHPLDFVAVTEHAEYLAELDLCLQSGSAQYALELCRDIRNESRDPSLITAVFRKLIIRDSFSREPRREVDLCADGACGQRAATIWQRLADIADEFYVPGRLTTFPGYEWTANTDAANLHRNVIFRDRNVPPLPASYFEASTPLALWQQLAAACSGDCDVLLIPHNSNQSNGRQFLPHAPDGSALSPEHAALRRDMEPLVEIIQAKGESECRPGFGSSDELCGFEKIDRRPACAEGAADDGCAVPCRADGGPPGCVWARNYVRNALQLGLRIDEEIGTNPFRFGVIGSTDTHNGTPGGTDEANYQGHHGVEDGSPAARAAEPALAAFTPQRVKGSGGLAGVWAEENNRAAIFAALQRREAFATSGTRIKLRFFGGWGFPERLAAGAGVAEIGYRGGVPMGGELHRGPPGAAPSFLLRAVKGVDGLRLQRLQIVKGWRAGGRSHERVYDVACSDALRPDPQSNRCPDNQATVDLSDCSVSADKGATELRAVWRDPDFDAAERAFYYARVLENPSCRWSSYEALREGTALFDDIDAVIQERAWSSAIWYTPQ